MALLSDDVMRFFLPAYLAMNFLFTIVIRVWVTKRRIGVNPLVHTTADDVYGYIKTSSNFVAVGVAGTVGLYMLSPEDLSVLAPISWLQADLVRLVGVFVLLFSLVLIVIAQSSLGGSWRIGIDKTVETKLEVSGLYQWSRNPIFLGFRLTMLGVFLVVPNAATFALLLLTEVLLGLEVRCEEEHLRKVHGARFDDYCLHVRRWL